MQHVAEVAKGRWLFYVAVCTCGYKARGWTPERADDKMQTHIVMEADK